MQPNFASSSLSHLRCSGVAFCMLLLLAAGQSDLLSLARFGQTLTEEQAKKLQSDVQKLPDSTDLRAQLLGYDLARQVNARPQRLQSILWMIEHRPTDRLTGSIFCQVDPADDAEGFAKAKAAWETQIAGHPNDAALTANAAGFFSTSDFGAAEALLQQSITLEPKNADWPERLAQLYEQRFVQHPEDAARYAPAALQLRQAAYNLTANSQRRFAVLVQMPGDAIRAEDLISAKRLAGQLLATAPKFKTEPVYGDAIHRGNIAMGEIALHAGRIDEADQYLAAAGQTPGSESLATTGPDFILAKELLARGERGAVHDYLKQCGKFWTAGSQRLKSWIATVDAGGTPDM